GACPGWRSGRRSPAARPVGRRCALAAARGAQSRGRRVMSRFLPDADATAALGAALAQNMPAAGAVLYLHGELGAGKTTLARGLVRALGYTGSVRSPTYTLLE